MTYKLTVDYSTPIKPITPLNLTAYHITGTRFIALGDKLNEVITALNSREEKEPTVKEEISFSGDGENESPPLPDQREELEETINESLPINCPIMLDDLVSLANKILHKWNLTPKK